MMRITVRFFASHREAAGSALRSLHLPEGATAAQAWEYVLSAYPQLKPYGANIAFAVNQQQARADSVLHESDELAFLPPVAGG